MIALVMNKFHQQKVKNLFQKLLQPKFIFFRTLQLILKFLNIFTITPVMEFSLFQFRNIELIEAHSLQHKYVEKDLAALFSFLKSIGKIILQNILNLLASKACQDADVLTKLVKDFRQIICRFLHSSFNCLSLELLPLKLNVYGLSLAAIRLVHSHSTNTKRTTKINSSYGFQDHILFRVSHVLAL